MLYNAPGGRAGTNQRKTFMRGATNIVSTPQLDKAALNLVEQIFENLSGK